RARVAARLQSHGVVRRSPTRPSCQSQGLACGKGEFSPLHAKRRSLRQGGAGKTLRRLLEERWIVRKSQPFQKSNQKMCGPIGRRFGWIRPELQPSANQAPSICRDTPVILSG